MFIEKEICKNEDKEIIIQGLTSDIELIFNIVITIILGVIFCLVIESLVFLISFSFFYLFVHIQVDIIAKVQLIVICSQVWLLF